jgi:hypothetical protein
MRESAIAKQAKLEHKAGEARSRSSFGQIFLCQNFCVRISSEVRAAMPPTSDGIRTVGCSLQKMVMDCVRTPQSRTRRGRLEHQGSTTSLCARDGYDVRGTRSCWRPRLLTLPAPTYLGMCVSTRRRCATCCASARATTSRIRPRSGGKRVRLWSRMISTCRRCGRTVLPIRNWQ